MLDDAEHELLTPVYVGTYGNEADFLQIAIAV
jgi:hypothetical protein